MVIIVYIRMNMIIAGGWAAESIPPCSPLRVALGVRIGTFC